MTLLHADLSFTDDLKGEKRKDLTNVGIKKESVASLHLSYSLYSYSPNFFLAALVIRNQRHHMVLFLSHHYSKLLILHY